MQSQSTNNNNNKSSSSSSATSAPSGGTSSSLLVSQYSTTTSGGEREGGGGVGDTTVCRESLECLSLFFSLVPNAIELLNQEKHWRTFLVDMCLQCASRVVRHTASEQFLLIALKCSLQPNRPIQFFIQMLFTCLHSLGSTGAHHSQEYFFLLCRLLNYACMMQVCISNTEALLNNEIAWLKKLKQAYLAQQQLHHHHNENDSTTLAKGYPFKLKKTIHYHYLCNTCQSVAFSAM